MPSLYVKETPSTKVLSFTIEPTAAPTAPPPTAPAVVPELLPEPTLWPITPPATAPISAPKACAFRLFWELSTATFAGRMEIILTVLVSCLVLGSVSAYAANPFSDVEPSSWAYQSVEQLASAGIINGYPDGTFKGNKDITRYEMAQMVAKAMANQDRANAEQQAMINRLADGLKAEDGVDLRKDPMAMQRLKDSSLILAVRPRASSSGAAVS